ncbi:MAG: hypothetical protein AMJ53_04890 [Gammaproteobacteria bacterium SG8_11]|nr:MAG: hypothetical protein AMJ53_04890 [Gammaproteobacteria bacterium SG8_11]
MKSIRHQSGLTPVSIIVLLAIGAFFIMLGLRLTPIYLENFKVASHLEKLAKDPDTKNMSEDEILTKLFKRLDLDDVEHVTQEDVTIEQSDRGLMLYIDYEVRSPTIGNVDIVVSFAEKAEIPR